MAVRPALICLLVLCLLLAVGKSFAGAARPPSGDNTSPVTGAITRPVLTAAEHHWLNAHPVIRLGVDPGYAPYSEIDANGRFVGEAADYISIISRQLGIKFQISEARSWSGILAAVRRRDIDMVATVVALPERKKYLSFTRTYIKTPLVVMTRSDDFSLRSPDELAHRVVALVQGYSSSQQIVADYPGIQTVYVKTPLQGLIAVATGQADAYVGAIGVNLATARENGITNLRIATAYRLDNGQSMAVRDDWQILTRILDKALAAISDTQKASIQAKWVPQQIPVNLPGSPVLDTGEMAWIAAHRQIRVGLTEADEPNAFVNAEGAPAGFIPEYLKIISAKTGLKIRIVQLKNSAALLSQLDAGLVDMVGVQMSPTGSNDHHLLSVPFHIASLGIFARRGAGFIGGLADLKGKRVALTSEPMGQTLRRRQTGIDLSARPNALEALQAVLDGNADAAMLGVDTGEYLLEKHGIKPLRLVHVIPGEESSLRFAMRPDWPRLQEIVNKALLATTPAEAIAIRRRVLGDTIQRGVPVEKIVFWSLLALIVVLALFLLQAYRGNKRLSAEAERRRLADASATRSEQRFRNFFELGHTGMAITSLEQEWINVNPCLCEMLGYTSEELSRMTWLEMTHPDDIEADMGQFRQMLSGDIEHYSMDKRFIHKNGDIVYTHLTVSCQRRPDQSVEYILATLEDISERKHFEEALQALNVQLINVFETMSDGFVAFDANMNYTYVNIHGGEMLGRKAEDLIGKNYWQEFPEAKGTAFANAYERALNTQTTTIFEDYYAPFERWFENRIYPSKEGLSVFFTDITARKQAEKALQESEKQLTLVFENVRDVVFVVDVEPNDQFRFISVNRRFTEATGIPLNRVIGKPIQDVIPEPSLTLVLDKYMEAIRTRKPVHWDEVTEYPTGRKTGMVCVSPVFDASGHCIQLIGTVYDITELMKATQALRDSEDRYRKIFETSPDAISITRLNDGVYVDVNSGFENISGFRRGEVLDKTSLELNIWRDSADRQRLVDVLKKEGVCQSFEAEFYKKSGEVIYGLMSGVMIKIKDEDCIITITRDITSYKFAESKVKRLSQLYAALSQCNQAIVRCSSETQLLDQICQDTVEFGGMKMAWIGMIDEASRMLRPVASFGSGTEYLEGIEISLDADSSSAGGPSFMAIHTKQPVWVEDVLRDPSTSPWHERARKFAWGAAGFMPLYRKSAVIGVFAVYSGDVGVLDAPLRELLIEMSTDISFALNNLDIERERNQALEKIKFQNTVLRTQQETSLDAIMVVDENQVVSSCNQQFAELWQLPEALLEGSHDALVVKFICEQIEDSDAFSARVQYLYAHPEEKSRDEIVHKDGRILDRYSSSIVGTHGEYYGRIWYYRDITERKRAEERISYLANYDALTGLPNRSRLADHLAYALSLARRRDGHFAMMFIDIDRFKDINDTLGHSVGDAFLVEIARRLQTVLREEDTASRLGGDEFILMLPDCDAGDAAQVAEKLLHTLSEPCRIEHYDLAVTASIGIALYPDDGIDMESLFKSADNAMYRAKQKGRDGYQFFTRDMQAGATRNMQLVNALRFALERDQFELHYQPQVSCDNGRIVGVEALLRWTHPELGSVSPAEFIPLAEDSRLILPIGEWVLRTAVKQLKRWMDSGYPPMVIAVNLSVVQFRDASLSNMISSILSEIGLAPHYLELELTEGVAMYDPQAAITVMNTLNDHGIHMSIDDFGTGYSSLNYLKKFKVDKLKIDQSFVRDIGTDQDDMAIVEAIIGMSRSLGLRTIAEGVENAEQLAYLRARGCDEAQGYFISTPLAADQLEAYLASDKIWIAH